VGGYKRALILTEDTYGVRFFKKLCQRLKELGLLNKSLHCDVRKLPGKCSSKTERLLRARENADDLVVMIADAHGADKREVIASLQRHIPQPLKTITHLVTLDYSIEEWICKGLDINCGADPITALDSYLRRASGERYEKYMLPNFADRINIHLLVNRDKNFEHLLQLLQY